MKVKCCWMLSEGNQVDRHKWFSHLSLHFLHMQVGKDLFSKLTKGQTRRLEVETWSRAVSRQRENLNRNSRQRCRIHLPSLALSGFSPASAGCRPQLLIGYLGELSGCVGGIVVKQSRFLSHDGKQVPPPSSFSAFFLPTSFCHAPMQVPAI